LVRIYDFSVKPTQKSKISRENARGGKELFFEVGGCGAGGIFGTKIREAVELLAGVGDAVQAKGPVQQLAATGGGAIRNFACSWFSYICSQKSPKPHEIIL
jgi:hypothetical protein